MMSMTMVVEVVGEGGSSVSNNGTVVKDSDGG